MSFDTETLFRLLPAHLRARDIQLAADGGNPDAPGPLKALLSVLAEQMTVLEENLDQLYDDQFIESCAEWVVPYIGDLVAARGVFTWEGAPFSQRAQAANTIAYRRRKGTASVLEQLARDVTGWDSSVAEFFLLLATTQYMNHVRPENLWSPSLRNAAALEFIGTPFEQATRTLNVRNIATAGGRHNIPNVGLHLWRVGNFSATDASPFHLDARRILFDPLGRDIPLFRKPVTEVEISHLASEFNVPMPISRRALHAAFKSFYGLAPDGSLQSIFIRKADAGSGVRPVLASEISVCDLSDLRDSSGNITGWAHAPQDKIGIDPQLGRIAFPLNVPAPSLVSVSYNHGFTAAMGGGEYTRIGTFTPDLSGMVRVPSDQPTLQAAIDSLRGHGVIEIEHNGYLFETPVIHLGSRRVEIRSAEGRCAVLVLSGPLRITGTEDAELVLNGLWISGGSLSVSEIGATPGAVRVRHCTLAPAAAKAIGPVAAQPAGPRIVVETDNTLIEIRDSITGSILAAEGARVSIANSIVDGLSESAPALAGPFDTPGAPVNIVNSTMIGKLWTSRMTLASNTIFLAELGEDDLWPAPVRAERLQEGCVRFSFVSTGSRLPRLFRCQPADVTQGARMRPVFTSLTFGDPGYCQLDARCAVEILEGADDGAEMGAFHNLFQPQRRANVRTRLDEYLRFGLEAGIFFAT